MNFIYLVICVLLGGVYPYNLTCGVDKSKIRMVYEGSADMETYPWMGTFMYQLGKYKLTTSVILVTKQIALGSAHEINKLPKYNLREHSRVIFGQKCSGSNGIRIRDYAFHPEYEKFTHSSLVMLQLDMDLVTQDVAPICPPPTYFIEPNFYAMVPSKDCKKGKLFIRKMHYVSKDECSNYYRKALNMTSFWPTHTVCARAKSGGKCVWRSGTALVVKQDSHWRLLGFGLIGPGCQAPSRFLDYTIQEEWVSKSVARIGQPAITRLSPRHLIMRRTTANLQRYGHCDEEEIKYEIYTDSILIRADRDGLFPLAGFTTYNVTLVHGVEYSCIVFKVEPDDEWKDELIEPMIYLRRWCAGPPNLCYDYHLLEIQFYVEIPFAVNAKFTVAAYGKPAEVMDYKKIIIYFNSLKVYPEIPPYKQVQARLIKESKSLKNIDHKFFHKGS